MENWILNLILGILTSISGPIREDLEKFARDLREKAKATENPWDDIVANGLCWLIGIK